MMFEFDFTGYTIQSLTDLNCTYSVERVKPHELLYIGVCRLQDVFRIPDAYKNSYFRENIGGDTNIKLVIYKVSDSQSECFQMLTNLARQHRPTANTHGHIDRGGKRVVTCIQGPNAGKSYETISKAAQMNGISQPTLSNHLNGVKGYTVVGGMRFKRGLP